LEGHRARQVALGDGADDARGLAGRMHDVGDQAVDRFDRSGPGARHVTERGALVDAAVASDDAGEALELARHALVERDRIVERLGYLAVDAVPVLRETKAEGAALQRGERRQEQPFVEGISPSEPQAGKR